MQARVYTAVCTLLSAGLVHVVGQLYHFPTVSIDARYNTSCPPKSHIDAVKKDISSKISGILTKEVPCGSSGWKRAVLLNMSDPDQTCPTAWRMYEEGSTRACGRQVSSAGSCNSVQFSVDEHHAYTTVCGRISGYGFASPDSGRHIAYTAHPENAINEPYLDGVSITYGTPRKHIWSFYGEVVADGCCSQRHIDNTISLGFIGDNAFCDTGNPTNGPWGDTLFTNHPLWDGVPRCPSSPTCCTSHPGPWFYTSLLFPTIADIEIRICSDQGTGDEDTPIELIEIYIK